MLSEIEVYCTCTICIHWPSVESAASVLLALCEMECVYSSNHLMYVDIMFRINCVVDSRQKLS